MGSFLVSPQQWILVGSRENWRPWCEATVLIVLSVSALVTCTKRITLFIDKDRIGMPNPDSIGGLMLSPVCHLPTDLQ
jgi:hypothetical protein